MSSLASVSYRGVLFDLDGTLLDTLDDLTDSMNLVLEARGLPVHDRSAYRYHVGDGVENLVRRALPEVERDAETVRACVVEMREVYSSRWDRKTRPYEGIRDLLGELERRGLRRAVLSNKSDSLTRSCISHLLAGCRFDVVVGARPKVPRKPDPSAALAIAHSLGVAPGRWLYLGDTDTDMRTASAAGMFALGALWGFRDAAELLAGGAQGLLDAPRDLLRYVT